tara:strand:- start:1946 stop:2227 length:282 start_codon:yes stop_codon:yes gene_type:complete
MSEFPLVLVEWLDSTEPYENAEVLIPDEIPEPQRIISVGHMVKETDTSVTLVGSWKPQLDAADYVITIVKSAIVGKIERLEKISSLVRVDRDD